MRILTHSKTIYNTSTVRIGMIVLCIFFSLIGSTVFAKPIYTTSSIRSHKAYYSTVSISTVGCTSTPMIRHAAPAFQMANTSAYQMATTYAPAQTIYTPFTDDSPSSTGPAGQSRITGRKNGFLDPGNPGQNDKETQSPIGDAWPLLIFAALGAGVIYLKQRKRSALKA